MIGSMYFLWYNLNIGGLVMDRYDKQAIEVYKAYEEFYGKKPNLNAYNFRNLTIEIQVMCYFLNEYGVCLAEDGFVRKAYESLDLPMSMNIQDVIVGRLIGSSDDFSDNSRQFPEKSKKTINTIGRVIRGVVGDTSEPIETLRLLSYISYIKKYVIPSADDEKIRELANCELSDLDNQRKVTNAIKEEMCKDNFDDTNIENVRKMIGEESPAPYGMFINESGNGKDPVITKESRKAAVKTLLGNRKNQ